MYFYPERTVIFMNFNFFMPTTVLSGENVVVNNSAVFNKLGRKCLIVTGGESALKSGALSDVIIALMTENIEYKIYDKITQNPLVSSCFDGAKTAREFNADFIVGIGGGSPLDAAKAITVLATNDLTIDELFNTSWKNAGLPLVLIGTTAGTGSEITKVSVLTIDDKNMKKSIAHNDLYAVYSLCDPQYTETLPYEFTVSTALDALAHAIEGYFSCNSDSVSDIFALKAVSVIVDELKILEDCKNANIPTQTRENLYYASLFAGFTLNTCGASFPHSMGYVLSEDFNIPHGRACAVFLPEYIKRGQEFSAQKAKELEKSANMSISELCELIEKNNDISSVKMTEDDINKYTIRFDCVKNFAFAPGGFTKDQAVALIKTLFH